MRHSCIFVGLLLFVLTALSATGAETLDHELVPSNLGEADFVESSRLVLVNNERDECSSDANQRTNGPQVRRRGKACVPRKTPIRGSKFHENGATNRPNSGTSPDSQKENPAFPFDEFDNYELCPIDRYGLINSIPVCDSGVLKDRAYQPDGSWRLFHATLCELSIIPSPYVLPKTSDPC